MGAPALRRTKLLRRLAIVAGVLIVAGAAGGWIVTIPAAVSASDLPPYQPDLANGKTMFAAGCGVSRHVVPNDKPDKSDPTRLGGGLGLPR